jgi:multiple sugar transport system permease protein
MQSVAPKRRRGMSNLQKQNLRNGMLFISPWIIGFSVFLAYPILTSFYYSLCNFSVLQPPRFVGLANYQQLMTDDVFHKALGNTVFYAVWAIPLGIILALSIAMLLNTGVKGMAVYRTIYFLPSLVPQVALAVLWLWILNGKSGILNYVLRGLGGPIGYLLLGIVFLSPILLAWIFGSLFKVGSTPSRTGWAMGAVTGLLTIFWAQQSGLTASLSSLTVDPPNWLTSVQFVKPAFVLMSLWTTGNAVVIYLAGLQDVPVHLYEAADLDGANWWQKTKTVTLPMISPVILFNGIMAIIGTFNFFAIPYIVAPGGQPARNGLFLAVNLYDNAFMYLRMGYAAAMAWVLFVIVFLLTMAAMKLSERHVHYGS